MSCHRLAFVGLLAAFAIGVTACSDDKESGSTTSTSTTTSTESNSAVLPVEERGVVTIRMATIGDPGN
jgi:hypothetical protein